MQINIEKTKNDEFIKKLKEIIDIDGFIILGVANNTENKKQILLTIEGVSYKNILRIISKCLIEIENHRYKNPKKDNNDDDDDDDFVYDNEATEVIKKIKKIIKDFRLNINAEGLVIIHVKACEDQYIYECFSDGFSRSQKILLLLKAQVHIINIIDS